MDTGKRIFELVDQKYKEQKNFAADLGLKPSVISAWRTGRSKSYMDNLPSIAGVLGTTVEYLITGSVPVQEPQGPTKHQLQAAFWGGDKDLTQEEKDAMWADVERFAAFLAEQKRREKGGNRGNP